MERKMLAPLILGGVIGFALCALLLKPDRKPPPQSAVIIPFPTAVK